MQHVVSRLALRTAASLLLVAGAWAQPAKTAGHWQGKIKIGDRDVPIVVDLAQNGEGVWIGSITVTGSSSRDVPLSGLTVGAIVQFTASLPEPAKFKGSVSADGKTLSGTASNAQGDAPFELMRAGDGNVRLPPPSSRLTKEFEGEWLGTLDPSGRARRIGLKLAPAADGSATATITVIEKNMQLAADTVTLKGAEITFELRAVSGVYRGTLGAGGEIAGEWSEGGNRTTLTFARAAK